MKRKILISINPEHVQNIIAGIKKYEYWLLTNIFAEVAK